jgi:hypothetical protein
MLFRNSKQEPMSALSPRKLTATLPPGSFFLTQSIPRGLADAAAARTKAAAQNSAACLQALIIMENNATCTTSVKRVSASRYLVASLRETRKTKILAGKINRNINQRKTE